MQEIEIGGRLVGPDCPAYIVAEIGFNHEGRFDLAVDMIRAAAESGVDAVKFQTFSASKLVLRGAEHFGVIEGSELSPSHYPELVRVAGDAGVAFFSTPFDFESLKLLAQIDVPAIKIASMDLTNLPLLREAAELGCPLLISTGMATIKEIDSAVNAVSAAGNDRFVLMHCISAYPAEPGNAHLRTMDQLREQFDCLVGYSDHVEGNRAALVAATRGACVIEKHFTSDKSLPGPDHGISSDPEEMSALMDDIRSMESVLGKPCADETRPDRGSAAAFRRGVYAAVDIAAGNVISGDMIKCVRPENELAPDDAKSLIGRTARQDIACEAPITWEAV